MIYSMNNRLILESYKEDRSIRANTNAVKGFAMADQKIKCHGLLVLADAYISVGTETKFVPAGSHAYIKEELLAKQPWAQKVLKSDAVVGDFIIVDLMYVEFISESKV